MRPKLIELQGEIDSSTVITGEFNNPMSDREGVSRRKISTDMVEISSTIHQLDTMDTYDCTTTTEGPFFSSSHGRFTKVNHFRAIKYKQSCQNLKATKMSFNRWMQKWCGMSIQWNIVQHWKRNELAKHAETQWFQTHVTKWKKLICKGLTFWKRQNMEIVKRISGGQRLEGKVWVGRTQRTF